MSEATVIRAVFPRHPVKRLARLLGLPIGTAHEWTYRNLSANRRRELARALLDEFDRQDREERAALRRQLEQMAGAAHEVGCGVAGEADLSVQRTPAAPAPHRAPARRMGGEMRR